MKILFICILLLFVNQKLNAQNNKGINFQAIARNTKGFIVANKKMSVRISILKDTLLKEIEYQEIKNVITNVIGLFTISVGTNEENKIITINSFENIDWTNGQKILQIEIDPEGSLLFENLGYQTINYVPYSFFADHINANGINGILNVQQGGTGVNSLLKLKSLLSIDQINNTSDSSKPINNLTAVALNERLKKVDTIILSNRINTKLNSVDTNYLHNQINLKLNSIDTINISNRINAKLYTADTAKLSNRINIKLNSTDTNYLHNQLSQKMNSTDTINISNRVNAKLNIIDTNILSSRINKKLNSVDTINLSNRINNKINLGEINKNDIISAIGYNPVKNNFGNFYDTSKQATTINTATAIKLNFQNFSNQVSILNNSSGNPTRISVLDSGVYTIKYSLQCVKADAGNDEMSVWLRKNSSAYPNTHISNTVVGGGVKNYFTNSFLVELKNNDYVEIYFSIKNANSILTGSPAITTTPSRPATPSAMVSVQSVN